jgi:hypothetical protein
MQSGFDVVSSSLDRDRVWMGAGEHDQLKLVEKHIASLRAVERTR